LERLGAACFSQFFFDGGEHLGRHLASVFIVVGVLASVFFGDEPAATFFLLDEEHEGLEAPTPHYQRHRFILWCLDFQEIILKKLQVNSQK
jgi:hypothetical protein